MIESEETQQIEKKRETNNLLTSSNSISRSSDNFIYPVPVLDDIICDYDYETQTYTNCRHTYKYWQGGEVTLGDPNCVGDDCYKYVDRLAQKYERKFIPEPYQGPEFNEFYCLGYGL